MRQNNDEFVRKYKHEQKMKASLDKIAKESAKENEGVKGGIKFSNTTNFNEEMKNDRMTELSPNKQDNIIGIKENLN